MKKLRLFALTPGLMALLLCCSQARVQGQEIHIDFDQVGEEWLDQIEFYGTSELRDEEGVNDTGYLSVTDALNGQSGAIEFPDVLDGASYDGAVKIMADLRVGGGTARPADGFSFNLVRPDDPLLGTGTGYAASQAGEQNLPEEGSITGLAIGFDEWQSGPADPDATDEDCGDPELFDCVGISVRIDDEVVAQAPFPILNGEVDDLESLQTGPEGADILDLDWAPFLIELSADNNLKIVYKERVVFDEAIDYDRGPGQLFFGGRTGGANSNHHIDNIWISVGGEIVDECDYDGDGSLGEGDINILSAAIAGGDMDAKFDVNGDGAVNVDDLNFFVTDESKIHSWMGDANLDGEFSSTDLVAVFAAGTYEIADAEATWGQGDWNADLRFGSGDLVAAFAGGGYEVGPRGAAQAVPEPAGLTILLLGSVALLLRRRR